MAPSDQEEGRNEVLTPRDASDRLTVASLREQVGGDMLQPGDAGYDEARTVWNGME